MIETQRCLELYKIDRHGELIPITQSEFLELYKNVVSVLNEVSPPWLEIKNKRQFYETIYDKPYIRRWRNHLKARTMMLKSAHQRRVYID